MCVPPKHFSERIKAARLEAHLNDTKQPFISGTRAIEVPRGPVLDSFFRVAN